MNKQNFKRQIARIYPAGYRQGFLILNYHSVNPDYKYSTHPNDFEKQMSILKKNYEVIPLNDLNTASSNFLTSNKMKIIITFDDGFEDNYLYAYPILKRCKIPATIFLVSDFIFGGADMNKNWVRYSGLKPLKIKQIKEMENSSIVYFGSHGKTHKKMRKMSIEEFTVELVKSKKELEAFLAHPIIDFAFPYGQKRDRGMRRDKLFKRAGYATVCTTDWGNNTFQDLDLYSLKRISIDHNDSLKDFTQKVSGKWDFVQYFQHIKNCF